MENIPFEKEKAALFVPKKRYLLRLYVLLR